jgi:hypothetical protein
MKSANCGEGNSATLAVAYIFLFPDFMCQSITIAQRIKSLVRITRILFRVSLQNKQKYYHRVNLQLSITVISGRVLRLWHLGPNSRKALVWHSCSTSYLDGPLYPYLQIVFLSLLLADYWRCKINTKMIIVSVKLVTYRSISDAKISV